MVPEPGLGKKLEVFAQRLLLLLPPPCDPPPPLLGAGRSRTIGGFILTDCGAPAPVVRGADCCAERCTEPGPTLCQLVAPVVGPVERLDCPSAGLADGAPNRPQPLLLDAGAVRA